MKLVTGDGFLKWDKDVLFREALKLPEENMHFLKYFIAVSRGTPLDYENILHIPAMPQTQFNVLEHIYKAASRVHELSCYATSSKKVLLFKASESVGRLGFVQKVDLTENIIQETKALAIFKGLKLKHSHVPENLGVQQVDPVHSTLFTSLMPGDPIERINIEVSFYPHGTEERLLAMRKLYHANVALGQALGELNSKKLTRNTDDNFHPISSEHIYASFDLVERYAEVANIQLPHSRGDIKKAIKAFEKVPIYTAFVHQDPHLLNFLYDDATKRLSMIDIAGNLEHPENLVIRHHRNPEAFKKK